MSETDPDKQDNNILSEKNNEESNLCANLMTETDLSYNILSDSNKTIESSDNPHINQEENQNAEKSYEIDSIASDPVLPLRKNMSGDMDSNQDKVISESIEQLERKINDFKSIDIMETDSNKTIQSELAGTIQNAKNDEVDFTSNSVLPLVQNMSDNIEPNQDKVIPKLDKAFEDLKSNVDDMDIDLIKTTVSEISDTNQKENQNAKNYELDFTTNSVVQLDENISGDFEPNQDKVIPESNKNDDFKSNLDNLSGDIERNQDKVISDPNKYDHLKSNLDNFSGDNDSNHDKVFPESNKNDDDLKSNSDNLAGDIEPNHDKVIAEPNKKNYDIKSNLDNLSGDIEPNQDKVIPEPNKNDDLKSNLDDLSGDIEPNQDKVIPEPNKNDDLKSNLDDLSGDIEPNQDKVIPEPNKNDDFKSNLDDLSGDIEPNQDKVIPESNKNDDLKSNLDDLSGDIEPNQDKVIPESNKNDLKSNLDDLSGDIEPNQDKVIPEPNKNDDLKSSLDDLSGDIESNQDKVIPEPNKNDDDLKSNLDDLSGDIESNQHKVVSDPNKYDDNLKSNFDNLSGDTESNQDKVIPEPNKKIDDIKSPENMEVDEVPIITNNAVINISSVTEVSETTPMEVEDIDDISNEEKLTADIQLDKQNEIETVLKPNETEKEAEMLENNLNSVDNSKIVENTTTNIQNQPSTSKEIETVEKQMDLDISDEIPEVDDSLGLLAESSRTVEEDDDQDDEDDDDDDEQDEETESNHRTPEFSEDSNAHTSEDNRESDKQIDTDLNNDNALDSFTYDLKVENMDIDINIDADNTESVKEAVAVGDEKDDEDGDLIEEENKVPDEEENEETSIPQIVDVTTEQMQEKTTDNEVTDKEDMGVTDDQVENVVSETATDKITDVPTEKIDQPSSPKSSSTQEVCSSPKKMKLQISKPKHVLNIVDLEESSSEDDILEVSKPVEDEPNESPIARTDTETLSPSHVTSVNLPKEIDVMSNSCGNSSDILARDDETIISGVPKPAPPKIARLNTSEVSIKTTNSASESTLVIPEAKSPEAEERSVSPPRKGQVPYKKPKFSLEVFNLDSDEEDSIGTAAASIPAAPKKLSAVELQNLISSSNKCMNHQCESGPDVQYHRAPGFAFSYFEMKKRKRAEYICQVCFDKVCRRMQGMMNDVRDMEPLLQCDMEKDCLELVEISDSDSDSDAEEPASSMEEKVGVEGAKLLHDNMANIINDIWVKYKMDDRLKSTKQELDEQLLQMEKDHAEIDALLKECQASTDQLRGKLSETFREDTMELDPIDVEAEEKNVADEVLSDDSEMNRRSSKRQRKQVNYNENMPIEDVSNQDAIPLGDTTTETQDTNSHMKENESASTSTANKETVDDNADISVVKLSAEVAPAGLPPPGELERPMLKVGDSAYVLRVNFGTWSKGKILEVIPRSTNAGSSIFSVFKVRLERSLKGPWVRQVNGRFVAYPEPATVRLPIGTRVVALVKDTLNKNKKESFYSGIVAEMPTPVNNYRYLVFFDDGYAQYVAHEDARVVCECSARVWEDVHHDSRDFVRKYLIAYPERPMVRLHAGQNLKTEWNGKWWISRVVSVDASLAQVHFEADDRNEWIYRGSTRLAPLFLELQAAERRSQHQRTRPVPRSNKPQNATQMNLPYVEYLRSDEQDNRPTEVQQQQENEEYRRQQRAVAKKSTAQSQYPTVHSQPQVPLDGILSRVVYYTPKAAVKPYKMTPHTCGPRCKRTDVLPLKELRTYNPLARPLLSGWERQVHRFKGRKIVMYRAPCGRRLRDLRELHQYLRTVHSEMSVDLFDYGPTTHCLAEFVLNRCNVSKKDLSHGKESVPIPCVNYYDNSLPEFCSYSTERTPTTGVPLNTDPDFLCGCDCTDDCQDKSKCACWKMTLQGAKTVGMEGDAVGYVYKRLLQPLTTGIYECNSKCKCAQTCLNRVAQHPLQLKLQVFKTLNRGWGIRALNDVPKGAFLCVYAGNLLTDATANLDGINEGDEYLAELDYIEVVEKIKEGYESDVPDQDKRQDNKEGDGSSSEDNDLEESSEDERRADNNDDDFRPAVEVGAIATEKKSLRKRVKQKDGKRAEGEQDGAQGDKEGTGEDECITISDDEEVREPSRFTAQSGFDDDDYVPKNRSVRSFFGKDEACYIMDAKVQGNIGRYLNHSCSPNVFVQNVFVDTHDPRFPWVAFFASCHIRAGTELTWNYNYDIGSVPDKVLYCRCGAPNCRGRLL